MKKYILLGLLTIGSLLPATAQTTILSQDFTTTTGWQASELDEDGDTWNTDDAATFFATAFTGRVAYSVNYGEYAWLPGTPENIYASPVVNLTGAGYTESELTFKIGAVDGGFMGDGTSMGYKVVVLTTTQYQSYQFMTLDLNTITPVYSGAVTELDTSEIINVDLTPYLGQQVRVLFWHTTSMGTAQLLVLDDVLVTATAPCVAATNVTASAITTTTATISWTAPASAPAQGYDYYVSDSNTAPDSGTTPTGSTAAGIVTANLTGLTNGTPYYAWVRSKCGVGNISGWSAAGTFVTTYIQKFCAASTVADLIAVGTNIKWYAGASGGSPLSAATALVNGTNYYASQTIAGCEGPRAVARVEITIAAMPTADAVQKFCDVEATVAELVATGTNIQWYDQSSGGSPLASETVLENDVIYYATQTINECESPRRAVTAVVGKEWTGAVSALWSEPGNWCNNELPTAMDNIIIPLTANQPVISGNITAIGNSLAVGEEVLLTVQEGNVLDIANAVVVDAEGQIVLENNAHLMQEGTTNTNAGAIEIHRNSSLLYRQDYSLWSSPVQGQGLRAFSGETVYSRFYSYNPTTNHYVAIFADDEAADVDFAEGQGYLIRMPNGAPEEGYVEGTTAINFEGAFTGTPNNGDITLTVTQENGPVLGYNAIGNPYPSPISIGAFFDGNVGNTNGIMYLWRRKNGVEEPSAYCTVNSEEDFVDNQQLETEDPDGIIQTGQGFIVKSLTGTINFTNEMRSATTAHDGSFFRMNNNPPVIEKHRVWLNLAKEGTPVAQMLVAYKSTATMGVDMGIDAPFINDVATGLNSYLEGKAYAIQGRSLPFDANDIVPLQFKGSTAGSYTIGIDHMDGLFLGNQDIYLKDNLLGVTHDIKSSDYSFTSDAGVFNTRFEIVYVEALGHEGPVVDANTIIIYKQERNLVINSGTAVMANVKVFDTRGRLVYERSNINAGETVISDLRAEEQMLIVQVTTVENGKVSKKVIY